MNNPQPNQGFPIGLGPEPGNFKPDIPPPEKKESNPPLFGKFSEYGNQSMPEPPSFSGMPGGPMPGHPMPGSSMPGPMPGFGGMPGPQPHGRQGD